MQYTNTYLLSIINLFTYSDHPIITNSPSNQSVTLFANNQNLTFTCEADRVSSYHWRRLDKDIPSTVTGVSTNVLYFNSLQVEDAGEYQCVATCYFTGSSLSDRATLTIKGLYNFSDVIVQHKMQYAII